MSRFHVVSLLLLLALDARAEGPAAEEVAGTSGMALCCRPAYWNCFEQCPTKKDHTDPGCLAKCETVHCIARSGACAKGAGGTAESAETSAESDDGRAPSRPGSVSSARTQSSGTLHYDGKLTGPGSVSFEAYNLDTMNRTLAINGVIFGRLGLNVKVLKTSQVFTVVPGKPTRFTLNVTQREFTEWSDKKMTGLTVAIGFADEAERDRWRFENLLTQKDVLAARPGEFQVKGAFSPTAGAKR